MVTVATAAVATVVLFPASSGAQTPWWVSALVALISFAGVVFVALYNARATRQLSKLQTDNAKALEELRGKLTEEHEEASALREYRFEARKRLYSELYPLLFQLGEQSEAALFRIFGLARSARTGKLTPESAGNSKSRLRKGSASYLPSTLYRFMAPLATYRLCERRLTSVDLSLDDELQWQYRLAKLLYRSWSDGVEIAEVEVDHRPPCTYDPGGDSPEASVSTQQHLSVQKIERVIESMLVQTDPQEPLRCVTLGEFFTSYESGDPALARAIKPLRDLFVGFSPKSRPVLWRLLIVHAHLYAGLSGRARTVESLLSAFDDEQREDLSWLDPALDSSDHAKRDEPFLAAEAYLSDRAILRSPAAEPATPAP
jgi:hypothetical protein